MKYLHAFYLLVLLTAGCATTPQSASAPNCRRNCWSFSVKFLWIHYQRAWRSNLTLMCEVRTTSSIRSEEGSDSQLCWK